MKQAQLGFVLILIVILGAVGYMVYQSQLPPEQVGIMPRPVPPAPTPTPQSPTPVPQGTGADPYMLTADEQAVLRPLKDGATTEERSRYTSLIQKLAKDTLVIDVGGRCTVRPVVVKAKTGATLTFRNNDNVQHIFGLSEKLSITLQPQTSKSVILDFTKGGGTFGYGCGNSSGSIGLIWVAG
jgi:plastocyanin